MALAVAGFGTLGVPDALGETLGFRPRTVALTFDDGPDPRFTPAILDTLRDHGARATFFVVGEHAEEHPELVARILAEGHEVAHHTHTHAHVETLADAELAAEMDHCLAVLAEHGITPVWYRPPRARLTPAQTRLAAERGMRVALWDRCFERTRFTDAEEMARVLAAETRRGDVLLAHDGRLDRTMTVEALPRYLAAMKDRGFRVVSLSELHATR